LRFHWTLSNSEANPRIYTCVTRPSHTHVHRIWARDYTKVACITSLVLPTEHPLLATHSTKVSCHQSSPTHRITKTTPQVHRFKILILLD